MSAETLIDAINVVSLITFSVLVFLAFVRMFYRLGRYVFLHEKVPILLKRDLGLFGVLAIYLFLVFSFRAFGVTGLGDNPLWVLVTAITLNGAIAFWVYVEYFKIDS